MNATVIGSREDPQMQKSTGESLKNTLSAECEVQKGESNFQVGKSQPEIKVDMTTVRWSSIHAPNTLPRDHSEETRQRQVKHKCQGHGRQGLSPQ
jgi:hypothetical protein